MEKSNNQFFDPYNFSQPQGNMPPAPQPIMPLGMEMGNEFLPALGSPAMQYEQQYMYYKYLTQLMEYKIKVKEYEKLMSGKV